MIKNNEIDPGFIELKQQINNDAYHQVVDKITEIIQDPKDSPENKMELINGVVVHPKSTNFLQGEYQLHPKGVDEKDHTKALSRAYFNNILNKKLLQFSKSYKLSVPITTHAFRHNYITELWKDGGYIMYIKQGHKRIESTAAYFHSLTDVEKVVQLREIDRKKEIKKRHTKTR